MLGKYRARSWSTDTSNDASRDHVVGIVIAMLHDEMSSFENGIASTLQVLILNISRLFGLVILLSSSSRPPFVGACESCGRSVGEMVMQPANSPRDMFQTTREMSYVVTSI